MWKEKSHWINITAYMKVSRWFKMGMKLNSTINTDCTVKCQTVDLNRFHFMGHCNNDTQPPKNGDVIEARRTFYCFERFIAMWHTGQIKRNSRHQKWEKGTKTDVAYLLLNWIDLCYPLADKTTNARFKEIVFPFSALFLRVWSRSLEIRPGSV